MYRPFSLPIVMFPKPSVISLSLCSLSRCFDSVNTPFVHRSKFVNTEWITPNLENRLVIDTICTKDFTPSILNGIHHFLLGTTTDTSLLLNSHKTNAK